MPKKVIPASPNREQMIDFVCEDLRDWEKRDSMSFWDHVQDLERAYLKLMDDIELKQIYEESI